MKYCKKEDGQVTQGAGTTTSPSLLQKTRTLVCKSGKCVGRTRNMCFSMFPKSIARLLGE